MPEPRIFTAQLRDVTMGEDVTVVEPSNLYECTLGDHVFVGPFCEIQKGVSIGARTKVQSHSFICELVSIGEDCFIGHGSCLLTTRFPTVDQRVATLQSGNLHA